MSAGLGGTGLVADDLYLMGHHEVSGKPYVQPRALGTGLAGALLAELMLGGGISLRRDGTVVPGTIAPGDMLACQVRGQIADEREPHPVRDWLVYLAGAIALGRGGRVVPGTIAPGDMLACQVRGQIADEREPHPVRDWLVYLARTGRSEKGR